MTDDLLGGLRAAGLDPIVIDENTTFHTDPPSGSFSDEEKADMISLMEVFLGDYDVHDQDDEDLLALNESINYYNRIARLYYVFTAKDFLCGHGYVSNYTGRPG